MLVMESHKELWTMRQNRKKFHEFQLPPPAFAGPARESAQHIMGAPRPRASYGHLPDASALSRAPGRILLYSAGT